MDILQNIPLSPLTTLKLGGSASHFAVCKSENEILSAVTFAKEKQIPFWILGGGSNTIVLDEGYEGLVIKNEIFGIRELSTNEDDSVFEVGAGEVWDDFVLKAVGLGLSGIECLSGIPGHVGASPIQNIGAYGQEVSDSILGVKIITSDLNSLTLKSEECEFRYRNSRFKSGDLKHSIITHVIFKLSKKNSIHLKYPEVIKQWNERADKIHNRIDELKALRELILNLRKSKSMVLDPSDPNTKSVGSFFMNPILTTEEKQKLLIRIENLNLQAPSFFPEPNDKFKVSAAWLIENSGFQKGFRREGVGISSVHCLALINVNGTTKSLLKLADDIREAIRLRFNINLFMEPVILG